MSELAIVWYAIGLHMLLLERDVDEDVAALLAALMFRVSLLEMRTQWSLVGLL